MKDLTLRTQKLETSAFLKPEQGLYISVMPSAASVRNLEPVINVLHSFGVSYTGMPNLHVTVLYSSTSVSDLDQLYKTAEIDPTNIYIANVDKFEYWAGHKNQGVLVLKLNSPQLEKVHYKLRKEGYKVNFPDYQAHMTFVDDLHDQGFNEKRSKQLVKILNGQLSGVLNKLELTGMKAESVS